MVGRRCIYSSKLQLVPNCFRWDIHFTHFTYSTPFISFLFSTTVFIVDSSRSLFDHEANLFFGIRWESDSIASEAFIILTYRNDGGFMGGGGRTHSLDTRVKTAINPTPPRPKRSSHPDPLTEHIPQGVLGGPKHSPIFLPQFGHTNVPSFLSKQKRDINRGSPLLPSPRDHPHRRPPPCS